MKPNNAITNNKYPRKQRTLYGNRHRRNKISTTMGSLRVSLLRTYNYVITTSFFFLFIPTVLYGVNVLWVAFSVLKKIKKYLLNTKKVIQKLITFDNDLNYT